MRPLEHGMMIALEFTTDSSSRVALSDAENGEQTLTSARVSSKCDELAKQSERQRPAGQIDANHDTYVGRSKTSVQFARGVI